MANESGSGIGRGIGKAFSAVGKAVNFLWNNPITKGLKFAASIALGPSLFVLGGSLSLLGRGVLEVGQVAHTRLVRNFDNTTVKKVQAGWESNLKNYKDFVTSSLEASMFAWYDTAHFVRDNWAARQDEAGYGNSMDAAPEDIEIRATLGGEKKFKELEAERVSLIDDKSNLIGSPSTTLTNSSASTLLLTKSPFHGRGGSGNS